MIITLQELIKGNIYTYNELNETDKECLQLFEKYLQVERIPYTINYAYVM